MCHTCTHTSTLRHWAGTSLKDWKQLKLSSAVALGRPVAARGELPQCISLSVSATHSDMRERDAALSETHCRTIHAHPHRDFVSCWSFTSFCVLFWGVCVGGGRTWSSSKPKLAVKFSLFREWALVTLCNSCGDFVNKRLCDAKRGKKSQQSLTGHQRKWAVVPLNSCARIGTHTNLCPSVWSH